MFIIKHQVIKQNTVGINRDHKVNNVTNTRYFTHTDKVVVMEWNLFETEFLK
jgi:hypothetical protein